MKRILSTAALSLSLFATTAAIAGEGYVTTDVSLRAGPDSSYPDVGLLYAGTTVAIEGCVNGWSWCDVVTGDSRGWLPANYLQQEYQGQRVLVPEYGVRIGIPIVAFVFGAYWDSHYRHRSWYGEREHWSQVRPNYQTVVVQGDAYRRSHDVSYGTSQTQSRTSQTANVRTVDESRRSAVVTEQPSHHDRHANTTTTAQHTVTTESRESQKYAHHAKPVEHHSVESKAMAQQHSVATQTRPQESHANHAKQIERNTVQTQEAPKPMHEHKAAQPKVIAEHKVAQPKTSKKDTSAKSRSEHQGNKDPDQH